MSSIKTTQIDGDVSVGRNVAIGGKADVAGSMTVGHNLKVEGWLEAANIKGVNKGVFLTVQALREAYPNPHDGWFAGVGSSTPFAAYIGNGGDWVATDGTIEVTVDMSQYTEGVAQLQEDIDNVKADVKTNTTNITSHTQQLTTLGNSVNKNTEDIATNASDIATNASDIATNASDIATLQTSVKAIEDSKGQADGIADLDSDGLLPTEYVGKHVVPFSGFASGTTLEVASILKNSTDSGCSVLFDKDRKTFTLRTDTDLMTYYNNWLDAKYFGSESSPNGWKPFEDRLYLNISTGVLYYFSDGEINECKTQLGLDNQEAIEKQAESVSKIRFVNANALLGDGGVLTLSDVVSAIQSEYPDLVQPGIVVSFYTEDGTWESWQWQAPITGGGFSFTDTDQWAKYGNGSAVGNCYNVTAARAANGDSLPTSPATYDTKQSAIEYAISKDAVSIGVQITFAASATTWQTYQYIGLTDDPDAYANLANWIDVAGQSAGDEAVVNINLLCRDISIATTYTLAEAIEALTALRTQKNVDYVKAGMVITYKIAEGEWETRQLIGGAADYTNPDAWTDFGGGSGSGLVANDAPEKDGTDAFSTGGAYKRLITNFEEEVNADGTEKTFQAVNAAGEAIGDPITIPISQGGSGGSTVSSFRIVFENNPLYAAANGSIIGKMAARSYTQEGEEIVYNKITSISILDATTGITLSTKSITNENSSSSLTDYKFELDFTDFFSGAGSREFTVKVTDQEGNVRSQNITVIAVDVTVEITKALNECTVTAGASTTTLDNFYRFEKNALKKDGGIDAVIEILYNGTWQVLGEANITDTFSKSISINPSNLLGGGETMQHGSYLLRIHGYAPNAKVTGNYVYTSIMCIDASKSSVPVVAIRYDANNYDENLNGEAALYDNVVLQVAAYTGASVSGNTTVTVYAGSEAISTFNAASSQVYQISYQVQNHTSGDTIDFKAVGTYNNVTGESGTITVVVSGSAIDVVLKDGAAFGYDFALRTNSDTDKTIEDNGFTMEVTGANWSSNGFGSYLGENALRIAENVTAEIPYCPFNYANAESSGLAVQFAFATNNIKDADALLMHCYDPGIGAGFYVKGNVAGIYCAKGEHTVQERKFRCGEKITMAVVVEPSSIYRERGGVKYSCIKMYLNGEEVACIGYTPGQSAVSQSQPIMFDGTEGDFYLYYIMAYQSHYEWAQAFNNYLAKLTDVTAMMEEFDSEDILNDLGVPSLDKMKAKNMSYYVIVAEQSVFDEFDSDTDTGVNFSCTLYYFNPEYPCLNFKATKVRWRRQGTTSAKRPVKNDRFYLNKASTMELLNPDETTELGRYAIALAAQKYTLVRPDAIPVQIITVKVDYSDSSNANDCGVCDMMNATFQALGSDYQTPAQRAFDGTFTLGDLVIPDRVMNHSTRNHPIAVFRATSDLMTDATFWTKGNWKEDKGEQVALGFQNTPGYNLGCVNYGEFVEWFGAEGETLAQACTRFLTEAAADLTAEKPTIDTGKLYLISQYCGRDYAFYKYVDGAWTKQTGSMKQVNGKWQVTGTVLNPVSGYELLSYQGFCWWMGVSSVADMMEMKEDKSSWVQKLVNKGSVSASTFPAWTAYFECMIDDDQLQIDLALGKKVPYDLYRLLKFCNDASYASGVDDYGYPIEKTGTDETAWKKLWAEDLWKYVSPHSLYAYTLFTDYLAATDQRAKNMQPMFFLEDGYSVTNGVYSAEEAVRMYANKVYDCDTCNGKDNDGGCTVDAEVDPNKPGVYGGYANPYAGWGSILFNNVDKCPTVYLDASHSTNSQLTLKTVCAAMRTAKTTVDGVDIVPFSPEGAQYFFVQQRLQYWKKLISSYDGERKYIEPVATSDAIYFYALQGLGLTALPQFIEQRWKIRDGYYQTGNFFSGVLSGRVACSSNSAKIRFKAAKTGYFGIGHDASGQLDESVFLEAGEEYEFTQFSHTEGALLYIYQADRMSEIDLSEISLDGTFNFSVMTLVEKIVIGGESHTDVSIGSYSSMSAVMLGNLPFLRELDIRNTTATSVDASGCPRIESILAEGSLLTSCTLAQTSPISVLSLPATMTELQFINLPNLSYPGGLTLAGMGSVTRLMVSGCANMDAMTLINGILQSSSLKAIGLHDVNITASVTILRSLMATKAFGLDRSGNDISSDKGIKCSGLTGRWILSELIEESELETLQAYFPALTLYNSQFSTIMFDDTVDATANITNLDNNTGFDTDTDFEPSGHFLVIEAASHAYKCSFNLLTNKMHCVQVSDATYEELADGTSYDPTDNSGEGFDIMKHLPRYWYKGVNDFKNQKKYLMVSSNGPDNEPLSTAQNINRATLATILVKSLSCIYISGLTAGDDYALTDNPNMNVYAISVDGMKQVRWPGVNNTIIGAVFLDANDKVISTYNMAVSHSLFDFELGDYIFCTVPTGAKKFVFTAPTGFDTLEAIAVDSDAIEAIEPDWVLTRDRLVGVYGMYVDSLMRPRSISGVKTQTGTGTQTTNADWKYDSEGNVANATTPTSTMNYTYQDMLNLCELRGSGYHSIDYEMSKDIANLVFGLVGDRDIQALCGYGCSSPYTTGANSMNTYGNVTRRQNNTGLGNLIFGIQNFVGCNWEIMDHVAVNVTTYASFKANKRLGVSGDPVDGKWHIYDQFTKTERVVPGVTSSSANCIGRVKFGRYADVIPSRVTSDTSKYNQNYSDGFWYSAATGRCVGRSLSSAFAYGGLVYAYACNASSNSSSSYGARLTFSGEIVFE